MAKEVELRIKVNAETGKIELVGDQLKKTGDQAKKTGQSFTGLGAESTRLLKGMLGLGSATAVLAFFRSAAQGAEEKNEAMRRLGFTVESTGDSWDGHRNKVNDWVNEIANSTRFTDTQAITTLESLARATGDVTQAQAAAQLAMGLSVQSGQDLATTSRLLTDLINGEERAMTQLRREFGAFIGEAKTTQEALDILSGKMANAAFESEGFTDEWGRAASQLGKFKDDVGNMLLPAFTWIVSNVGKVTKTIETMGAVLASTMAMMVTNVRQSFQAIGRAMRFDFSGARAALTDMRVQLVEIAKATAEDITGIWEEHGGEENRILDERIIARQKNAQKISDEEAKRREKELEDERKQIEMIEQINAELDHRLELLTAEGFDKKRLQLDREIALHRAKVEKEIQNEQQKQSIFAKLDAEQRQRTAILAEEELAIKNAQVGQTVDLLLQTAQIANNLNEKGTKSELNRARALLGMERAIAIARAISNAMKAPPGAAQALAIANVAFVIAQSAQAFRTLNQAAKGFSAGVAETKISTPLPDRDGTLERTFSGGGGSSSGGATLSGGGGGGGGATVIHVGGVYNNIEIDHIAIDNIPAVMREITERTRQGTVEAVRLAVQLRNTGERNAGIAV